jgi:hypothetical protein
MVYFVVIDSDYNSFDLIVVLVVVAVVVAAENQKLVQQV